jgi:phosphoribosyl 1,2-cyclic phosphodiesterase
MSIQVKFWGVRGSLPTAPTPDQLRHHFENMMFQFFKSGYRDATQIHEFLSRHSVAQVGGYGTATSCVEFKTPHGQIIIDGGSGLQNLGNEMLKGPAGKGKAKIHIFQTHFHWDHMLGIPFFTPHFIKGNEIHYYAVQPELEEMVRIKFRKPLFPVPYEVLAPKIFFHRMEPRKQIQVDDILVTPYKLDHPDECWGFKVESDGKVYSHCVDTEGTRSTREAIGEDLPLYQGVDLMYFDAQYTLPELAEKANWGHSAAQIGLDIAMREKIGHVLFGHHDPGAGISQINELRRQTREYHNWKIKSASNNNLSLPDVKWKFVHEGLVVNLHEL